MQLLVINSSIFFSPWSGDQMLFPKEHYRLSESPDLDVLDMDIASLEAELERWVYMSKYNASLMKRSTISSNKLLIM